MANFAILVPRTLLKISIENKSGCDKVVTELSGVIFWSEIVIVMSSRSRSRVRFRNHTYNFRLNCTPRFDAAKTVEASNMAVLDLFRITEVDSSCFSRFVAFQCADIVLK